MVVVVVIDAHSLGGVPFTFWHPIIISQSVNYPQCLKLHTFNNDLDLLWNYPLCIRHTLMMDKLTVCVNELPDSGGQ
jgi:hypothetical protein